MRMKNKKWNLQYIIGFLWNITEMLLKKYINGDETGTTLELTQLLTLSLHIRTVSLHSVSLDATLVKWNVT